VTLALLVISAGLFPGRLMETARQSEERVRPRGTDQAASRGLIGPLVAHKGRAEAPRD
jgi:hypothetical protein